MTWVICFSSWNAKVMKQAVHVLAAANLTTCMDLFKSGVQVN